MADATTIGPAAEPGPNSGRTGTGWFLSGRQWAATGFVLAGFAIYVGWRFRDSMMIDPGQGLGYALGIAGGIPMILLLLYSFRKRLRFMRHLGPIRYWFRTHMQFGIIGPVIILYHCNFQVEALNSKVALYCTLLVAGSGIVGRYLYAQIHDGLYGRKASLRKLTEQLSASSASLSSREGIIDDIRQELSTLSRQVLTPAETMWESIYRPVVLGIKTRVLFYRLSWKIRRRLIARSAASPIVAQHRDRLTASSRNFLAEHLHNTRRVAWFGAYERLFSLWHIVHVPFFIMMVISALVHVLAVHMY